MKYIVKAMSEEDRRKAQIGDDDGGQDIFPIGNLTASSDAQAERKLKKLIAEGVYPWDAVCDREE